MTISVVSSFSLPSPISPSNAFRAYKELVAGLHQD